MSKFMLMITLVSVGALLSGCQALGAAAEPTTTPTPVTDPGVIAEANLEPAEKLVLSFTLPGPVSEILVEEGDFVSTGDVLARLGETDSLEAQIVSAELAVLQTQQTLQEINENSALASAQASLNLVQARQDLVTAERAWDAVDSEDFQETLDNARVDMQEAEDDLEAAQETLADFLDLNEDHPTREAAQDDVVEAQQNYDEAVWSFNDLQNQYDLAKAALDVAHAALDNAQQDVNATKNSPDPDELALAEANLAQAEAQLKAAKSALAEAELAAPFAGKIVRVDLVEGAQAVPGELGMVLVDSSEWYLETNDLTEDEVVRIDGVDRVTVTFDALPNESFSGEVVSISEYFIEQFGDITYVVRIRLLDGSDHLRWGMTAAVKFQD